MFWFNVKKIPHPFTTNDKPSFVVSQDVEPIDNIISTTWGMSNIVKAKHTSNDKFEEWEIEGNRFVRLKAVDLDKFDIDIIRQRQINRANYKLVKPYVIAGTYTNSEIANVLSASKSWVERLTPRIKEAARNRTKTTPLS